MKMPACCAVLFVIVSASASAQDVGSTFEITPYLNLHRYSWKELNDDGSQLLQESGPRWGLGAQLRGNSFLQNEKLYVELELQYTRGTVDYNGAIFTQGGQTLPFTTQTVYWDFETTATAGYRLQLSQMFQLTPVAGFGYDHWNRDIANGGPSGYDEHYSVFLGNLGANGTYAANDRVNLLLGLLLKFPLSISETIDAFPRVQPQQSNVSLSPGSNPRVAFHIGASMNRVFAVFEVETWTLSRSPDSQTLHQPETNRTDLGIKIGYRYGFGAK